MSVLTSHFDSLVQGAQAMAISSGCFAELGSHRGPPPISQHLTNKWETLLTASGVEGKEEGIAGKMAVLTDIVAVQK